MPTGTVRARPWVHGTLGLGVRCGLLALISPLALGLLACGQAPAGPPNILLIIVDTLRYDHLSAYGYHRPTSPQIHELLADAGTVCEDAYAQAPWTLPSTASYLTGLSPLALTGSDGGVPGIPDRAETLAERLAALGYETAAFIANATMHEGNGYAQGFEYFHTAPYELASMARHADDLSEKLLPWVRTRSQGGSQRPFFLYAHYLDPHDPYDNADVVDGRSPFAPGYEGPVRGGDVHGFYMGALRLGSPADLEQLVALYDTEIRYVDRHVGQLLRTLGEETLANTLVVFSSDHGEELYDHGSFKHGESLYEHQIHVPLIFRWDGQIAAGARLSGTVRLVDLVPTLLDAAGGAVEALEGVSLLPALRGETALPSLSAYAHHLAGGAPRSAVVRDGQKLVLYDQHGVYEPASDRDRILWSRDRGRLSRLELYDLESDPEEQNNRLSVDHELPEQPPDQPTAAEILAKEDRFRDGLRLMVSGLDTGTETAGCLVLEGLVSEAQLLYPLAGDQLELRGQEVCFRFESHNAERGLWVQGGLRGLQGLRLEEPPVGLALRFGAEEPGPPASAATPQPLRRLLVQDYPRAGEGPEIRLWVRRGEGIGGRELDDETEERMRSLGYID